MTLPAFAAERRRLLHGTRSALAAINRYLLSTGRSAANPPAAVAAVARWVRQTDIGRTLDRYIDLAPPVGVGSVNNDGIYFRPVEFFLLLFLLLLCCHTVRCQATVS